VTSDFDLQPEKAQTSPYVRSNQNLRCVTLTTRCATCSGLDGACCVANGPSGHVVQPLLHFFLGRVSGGNDVHLTSRSRCPLIQPLNTPKTRLPTTLISWTKRSVFFSQLLRVADSDDVWAPSSASSRNTLSPTSLSRRLRFRKPGRSLASSLWSSSLFLSMF
jgi:hypothetical protein